MNDSTRCESPETDATVTTNCSSAGFKREVLETASLALPTIGAGLATGLSGFVESVIAGHHGTTTLASVSIGVAIFWISKLLPMGTLMALSPSIARLDASGHRAEIGPLFRQSLWLAIALGLILFALITIAIPSLERTGISSDTYPGASQFLSYLRWGLPVLSVYYAMRYLSSGLHWPLPAMIIGFSGLGLLIPLGYGFAFGKFGLPELGAGGLGAAWTLTICVQTAAFALYLARAKRFAHLKLFAGLLTSSNRPLWRPIAGLLRTGLPIGAAVMMEGGLFMVASLLIGQLGAGPSAAHQIAINVASLCYMAPFGIAEATAVRVGHALGSGRGSQGVRRAAQAGLLLVLVTQVVSGVTLVFGREFVASIYTRDSSVAALTASLLLFTALLQLPDGIQVLSAGALRGLKDTRVPMLFALLAYWGVGLPLAAGLGFGMGLGPIGMWAGLVTGLICAAVLLTLRFAWCSAPATMARSQHSARAS